MTGIASTALVAFFVAASGSTTLPQSWTDMPEVPSNPAYQVAMTGYNAVPEQTDEDPYTTASGAFSDPDIMAARSRDLADELPFGTVIAVTAASSSVNCGFDVVEDMIGLRVIGDTMNARMHNKVDILFDHETKVKVGGKPTNPARAFGVCKTMIEVVGHIDPRHMPKTQLELKLALGRENGFASTK